MSLVLGEETAPVNISDSAIHDLKIGDYVACTYEFEWYASIILDISIDNDDVYVKFMYPKGPSMHFKWPSKEDECWIALNNVLKVLKPPKCNQSERNFTFDENDTKDAISMKNYFFREFSYDSFILSYFKTVFKMILNSFPLVFQDIKAKVDFVVRCISQD